ncbi:TetR/AcrR family transcriptional regulator [Enterococcus sp. DIV0788_1]|uniref:TetR/AcrR family transcriptional regulator n=1 Tax=Enterococcus sp. DIV0788_1 TaxID=2774645 RepID=UPI003F684B7C
MLGARELIYQHGYMNTSISDILEFTNTGKGQLYYYFDSKKAIGLAVIQSLLAEWRIDLFEQILSTDLSAEQSIEQMIDWFFAFHQKAVIHYGCPVGNLIAELALADEQFREPLNSFMKEWQELVMKQVLALDGTQLTEEEAVQEANHIIGSLQGIALFLKLSQNINEASQSIDFLKKELKLKQNPK